MGSVPTPDMFLYDPQTIIPSVGVIVSVISKVPRNSGYTSVQSCIFEKNNVKYHIPHSILFAFVCDVLYFSVVMEDDL